MASSITDLAGSEEKLPLLLNQSVALSDIDLTVTHASGRRVNCGIEGISWSSDNAAVALISNGSLRGVTPGKAVLTGRIGALSVKLPIKVVEKLEAFDVSVTGKQCFDGGYALLTIDIPELEGAKSYSMMQHSLENSSSR